MTRRSRPPWRQAPRRWSACWLGAGNICGPLLGPGRIFLDSERGVFGSRSFNYVRGECDDIVCQIPKAPGRLPGWRSLAARTGVLPETSGEVRLMPHGLGWSPETWAAFAPSRRSARPGYPDLADTGRGTYPANEEICSKSALVVVGRVDATILGTQGRDHGGIDRRLDNGSVYGIDHVPGWTHDPALNGETRQ